MAVAGRCVNTPGRGPHLSRGGNMANTTRRAATEADKAARRAAYAASRVAKPCVECGAPLPENTRQRCVVCAPEHARRMRSERNARWARLNRERKNMHARRWQAQRRGVANEDYTRDEIGERDRWRCGLCGKKIDPVLAHPHRLSASIDHLVPLSEGGDNTRANVQIAHLACNSSKRNGVGARGDQLRLIG